jgi:hypothetical protein
MHMGMKLTVSSVSVNHCDIAPLEDSASHFTIEIIEALRAASHELTQQRVSVLVKGDAKHVWHGQDDMAVDHSLVKRFAYLAHPVVHVNFSASQA